MGSSGMRILAFLLALLLCCQVQAATYPPNCASDGSHAEVYNTALNTWTCVSLSGGTSVSLASTTSNLTYYLGVTTSTGGTLSTLYGNTNTTLNPSTGVLASTILSFSKSLQITSTTATPPETGIYSSTADALSMSTSNTPFLTATYSTGNITIGQTGSLYDAGLPGNVLNINSEEAINNSSVTQAQVYIKNSKAANNAHATIVVDKGAAGAGAGFGFLSAGTAEWDAGILDDNNFHIRDTVANHKIFNLTQGAPANSFNVTSAGHVGINTTAAADWLDVSGAIGITATSIAPVNGLYLSAANTLKMVTSGAAAYTLASNGNATFAGTVTDSTAQLINTCNGGLTNTAGVCSLAATGGNGSGAEQTVSYQPGLLTAVTSTKSVFSKFVKSSTVDNIEGSAYLFSCVSNPTITMYECGTDANCATTPTTIGSVTVTAAGVAVDGTVSNAAIAAGHYVAWALSSGTCTSLDIAANAQIHAN